MMQIPSFMLLIVTKCAIGSPPEDLLYKKIMADYNPKERPVENTSAPVKVTLGVALQQIIDMNEREEVLEVNAWLNYNWNDFKLKWEPAENGGVTDLRYPVGTVWQPDVLLYNSVDSAFDSTFPVNMLGYSDGTVTWIPPGIFRVSCKIDITFFPFDEQTCYFKFGSWTFSGKQLDLQNGSLDFSDYMTNGEWAIVKKFYDCCPDAPYQDVTFNILLRRRTLFYAFNLILPCLLTLLLTLLGFTLSPDACEKITLQITVCLAICFFLSILASMTPPTSEAVPLLGVFFSSCMVISTAATSFTVYVQNVHFRNSETNTMGEKTRLILLEWLPWLLRMKRPGKPVNWKQLAKKWSMRKQKSMLFEREPSTTSRSCEIGSNLAPLLYELQTNYSTKDDSVLHARLLMLQRIFSELRTLRKHDQEDDENRRIENEWRFAAMVIDRACLIVFFLGILSSCALIILRAPYLNA